ncbi:MAG: methyl-accepting chemotaxis protein [Tepidisphaeraceae bacterium]
MNVLTRLSLFALVSLLVTGGVGVTGYVGSRNIAAGIAETARMNQAIQNHMDIDMMHDALCADVLASLSADTAEMRDAVRADLQEHTETIKKNLEANRELKLGADVAPLLDQTIEPLNAYTEAAATAVNLGLTDREKARATIGSFQAQFNEMEERLGTVSEKLVASSKDAAAQARTIVSFRLQLGIVSLIAVMVIMGLGAWTIRAIVRPLRTVTAALAHAGHSTSSASAHIASASTTLAQSASQQAASTEETSAAVAEAASLTKRTADAANQASSLSKDVQTAAEHANASMGKMNTAVGEIESAASETAAIIKVINEIAFQTNLLALNAAVEAARAGEAGKGFAVVAEEVRNLALRSSEAAQSTSALIDRSVNSARNGATIAAEVGEALASIDSVTGKVNGLIAEIAGASREQATGIEQIQQSISAIDKLTQQGAASSEESASTASELKLQADTLENCVGQLRTLVGGA